MKRKTKLALCIVTCALILIGGLATFLVPRLSTRAAARQPLIFTEPAPPDSTHHFCPGFPVMVHTTGHAVFHVFFDQSGNVQRVLITAPDTTITFTNTITGASVWTPSVNIIQQYGNPDGTGTQTYRGLLDRVVVPGQGLVFAEVGRIDWRVTLDDQGNPIAFDEVFSAGQWDNDGNFIPIPLLCSLLG